MTRVSMAGLLSVALLATAADSAQGQARNMSDVTGARTGLQSRGVTVGGAPTPPALPPRPITTPAVLDALCVTRADALLTLAVLTNEARAEAEQRVLVLLRGGPSAAAQVAPTRAALVAAGAEPAAAGAFVESMEGLLAATPTPPDVAAAVAAHNAIVESAAPTFLASQPADYVALRAALGSLTAAAHAAAATGVNDPGLLTNVRYANDAPWLLEGAALELPTGRFVQYGPLMPLGSRQFQTLGEHRGVSILATAPVPDEPATVYVPVLGYCDVELQPYVFQRPVIKPGLLSMLMLP